MDSVQWNSCLKGQPEIGGEYLVVWELADGQPPVVASMDWDVVSDIWTDPRGIEGRGINEEILMWAELPEPPKDINP